MFLLPTAIAATLLNHRCAQSQCSAVEVAGAPRAGLDPFQSGSGVAAEHLRLTEVVNVRDGLKLTNVAIPNSAGLKSLVGGQNAALELRMGLLVIEFYLEGRTLRLPLLESDHNAVVVEENGHLVLACDA